MRRRTSEVPRTPDDVFRIYGPVTPQGLWNRMLDMARVGAREEFLSLLEANLIMEEYDRRRKPHPTPAAGGVR
jgi:hypothetical protein